MGMVEVMIYNDLPREVVGSRVDPTSKKELPFLIGIGKSVIFLDALPGTEWRFREMGSGMSSTPYLTYVTTAASNQVVNTSSSLPGTYSPATPSLTVTPVVTVTVTPGVSITGNPSNPPISLGSTSPGGITLVGAKDSIFNAESFDKDVIDLEYALRQQSGLTDKNERRAVTYARLIEIAKAPTRTPHEDAVVDWLARQVKKTRVDAARLALEEYDRWNSNPWGYQPPRGYDFPAYIIPAPGSPTWLMTTPNPPVLANATFVSFLASIISSNGWSPLNNPLLTKGQRDTSVEGVIGFPVFGAVLAYQKLYDSAEGARVFGETTENLTDQSFTLSPAGAMTIGSPFAVRSAYNLSLRQIAPYMHRNMKALLTQFEAGAGVPTRLPIASTIGKVIKKMTDVQLRAALTKAACGDVLWSFVTSLAITIAIQALVSESFMLAIKTRLRGELVTELEKQRSAPPPDLRNLLYYDINNLLVGDDYQPTDPVELERLMGSRELHRAFLLATL
jgi:hypothetical protein